MNKSRSNFLTLIFAFIGCFVTLFLLFGERISSAAAGCLKSGEGCATTTGSAYGHFGPVPTAVLGLLMYVAFAQLCLMRGKQLRLARDREATRAAAYASSAAATFEEAGSEDNSRPISPQPEPYNDSNSASTGGVSVRMLDMVVWGLALAGFGISIWLQYIAIYQLHSFCKFCFASATLVTLIFALASRDYLLDGRKLTGEQKMIGGVLALIVVLGSFMVIPDILDVINKPTPTVLTPTPVPDARVPLTASMLHSKGNPKAKYVVIEFADYQCGHCSAAAEEVEKLMKPHKDDIRLVFRNFPFPYHKWARSGAAAAEAAGEQGKFWEMHDLLFKHTKDMEAPDFADASFDEYARSLKLDVAKFDKDRLSEAIETRISADQAAADAGHLQSTPTFFFIAPSHVTNLPGTTELGKFLNKPNTKDWQ